MVEGDEHGEASSVAEELMAKGGPETEARGCQKLISVVAVSASEFVSRNKLIMC